MNIFDGGGAIWGRGLSFIIYDISIDSSILFFFSIFVPDIDELLFEEFDFLF